MTTDGDRETDTVKLLGFLVGLRNPKKGQQHGRAHKAILVKEDPTDAGKTTTKANTVQFTNNLINTIKKIHLPKITLIDGV